MDSLLDRLAERVGIAAGFEDALHETHQTPPETKRALLRAMGLPAADEAEAGRTLDELLTQEQQQVMPRCVVLFPGQRVVEVRLPAEAGAVRWTLHLEEGGALTGACEHSMVNLPAELPWGYHRLQLEGFAGGETSVIVTPGECWLPGENGPERPQAPEPFPAAERSGVAGTVLPQGPANGAATREAEAAMASVGPKHRFWGVAVQIYLLRSERNWGIGDFTDLLRLVEIVKAQGGAAVGVNPLHGLFPDLPEQASPYSPLSRYLLNILNIDVEAAPGFAESTAVQAMVEAPAFQERLQRCRGAAMVQYAEVAQLKLPVLQALYRAFAESPAPEPRAAFADFRRDCDPLLTESCVFTAIREVLIGQDLGLRDVGRWPEALKQATSAGVEAFCEEYAELVEYQLWLQWVADGQLAAVQRACEGMAVGLYRDLAVGANPGGAEVWSNPGVMVATAEVGAPPDILNTVGQNWVLPPFDPRKLKEDGYRSFVALLRTNMRHAGAIRIDHAMALERLYWIPRGNKPRDGGYVHYPLEDMIGVIALESHRNRCLVVGEDLGTVPHGFRERMAVARILSYKVLLLEEEEKGGGYVKGSSYQRLALSTASNHDLPTLQGWWKEVDLQLRSRLGFTPADRVERDHRKRENDRAALAEMFQADGLLEGKDEPSTGKFVDAAHRFLLRTQAVLMMAQLEDIVGVEEQVNLPASMPEQYPSWSRRSPVTLEELATDDRLGRLAGFARAERG